MGKPHAPLPVKLFCGLLSADVDLLRRATQLLVRCFGPVDMVSDVWPFDQTNYYEAEMGGGLRRQFVAFERLVSPESLPDIKHQTNALEGQIAEQCLAMGLTRPVNLDPGYVTPSKLVLATTKDSGHRVSIGASMYAEVTLRFVDGGWQIQPWTYPDYRQAAYHAYFSALRQSLLRRWSADRNIR